MKSILIVALTFFSFAFAKAQEADDCTVMLQIFAENAKARSYDEAYKQLQPLINKCPDASAAIYQYGERIYEHRLKNEIGDEDENAEGLINMLRTQVSKYSDLVNATKKNIEIARVMYKYDQGTDDEQYEILNDAFTKDKENFTDPNAMITYFKLVEKRYEDETIDLQNFFDIYDELTMQIETVQDERSKILNDLMDKEAAGTLTDDDKQNMDAQTTNIKNYGIVNGSVNATLSEEHQNIIELARKLEIDELYVVGSHFYNSQTNKYNSFECFEDLGEVLTPSKIKGGSHVLIKGSRGMQLERILEIL